MGHEIKTTEAKEGFTLEEARRVLQESHRWILEDSSFGDAECGWNSERSGGDEVAVGYFGRNKRITVHTTETRTATTFLGEEAQSLFKESASTRYYSNNE